MKICTFRTAHIATKVIRRAHAKYVQTMAGKSVNNLEIEEKIPSSMKNPSKFEYFLHFQ